MATVTGSLKSRKGLNRVKEAHPMGQPEIACPERLRQTSMVLARPPLWKTPLQASLRPPPPPRTLARARALQMSLNRCGRFNCFQCCQAHTKTVLGVNTMYDVWYALCSVNAEMFG